jgi:hypothetical protein
MIIDPGHHLRLAQLTGARVDQPHPADDVHPPQLHRRGPTKPDSAYQPSHRCTACLDTPNLAATAVTDDPAKTSDTAR